jgi:hypothetical protein
MPTLTRLTPIALALAVPALGLVMQPSVAQANVRHTIGAAACDFSREYIRRGQTPATFTEPSHNFMANVTADWGIYHNLEDNGSSFWGPRQEVSCAIPRGLPLSTEGLSDLEVRFRSIGYVGTRTVHCDAYSWRSDGSQAAYAGMDLDITHSSTVWVPDRVMDFNGKIGSSGPKGHYSISCMLPAGVSLITVYASEIDGIDGN